jgi:hypothetical protein
MFILCVLLYSATESSVKQPVFTIALWEGGRLDMRTIQPIEFNFRLISRRRKTSYDIPSNGMTHQTQGEEPHSLL